MQFNPAGPNFIYGASPSGGGFPTLPPLGPGMGGVSWGWPKPQKSQEKYLKLVSKSWHRILDPGPGPGLGLWILAWIWALAG